MKRISILLSILSATLIILSGCIFGGEKIDLNEYYQQGETWCISCDDSAFKVSYGSRNDNSVQIDIDVLKNLVNVNNIYVYSKGYRIIYNNKFCCESVISMPMFIPVGVYELPIEDNKVSFTIITEKEDFKGYIKVSIEETPTLDGVVQGIRFNVY